MRSLSKGWKLIGIVGLSLLVLVSALSCAGPAGSAGPAGVAGPAGPTLPVPSLVASPASVALSGGKVGLASVTFTGAGWDPAEGSVYIEIILAKDKVQMVVGTPINAVGAFSVSQSVAAAKMEVAAGVYTVRATSKVSGTTAYVPFTVAPEPAK